MIPNQTLKESKGALLTRAPQSNPEQRVVRRIRFVSALLGLSFFVAWIGSLFLAGEIADEFSSPAQWVPSTFILLASLAVFLLASPGRLAAGAIIRIGLVYEVAGSFGLAATQYLGAFENIPAGYIDRDLVGISLVAVWMLAYTVLVPAAPWKALIALIASASAAPLIYVLSAITGTAPSLPPDQIFLIFVLPYAVVVLAGYWMARIVHRLGNEARQALELGSYRLEAPIGRGGMGEVWRASHRMLIRPAAVKLIRTEALRSTLDASDDTLARFEREAQVTASLQSPHTVELYDFGIAENGTLYYVMELLDGINLDSLVTRFGPLPPERVVHVLRQACSSLGEAHRHGLVHRDIKPSNILLCRRAFECDFVKVLDFGLVKHQAPITDNERANLTKQDAIAGTPSFMAPEMIVGQENLDGRTDLYALGCVAYWLLTGRIVFEAPNAMAMMVAHAQELPQRPSQRCELAIPQALEDLVMQCLAKHPAERPQSAEDLSHQLANVPIASPWTPPRATEWWEQHRPNESEASS